MAQKRSVGQPPHDDTKALREVKRILADHPKWSRTKAALHYAEQHPEEKATAASIARRLADKLKRKAGIPPRLRARRRELLGQLHELLIRAALIVEVLRRLDEEPRE